MASLQGWVIALIVILAVLFAIFVAFFAITLWAKEAYKECVQFCLFDAVLWHFPVFVAHIFIVSHRLVNSPKTQCDIDTFVGSDHEVKATKVVLLHKFRLGNRKASVEPIPLECVDSKHVPGLKVSRKASGSDDAVGFETILEESAKTPIIVATIRMGFGHHRLAYSAASWALKQSGHPVIFHDLLSIESPEADLIKDTDELYSRFSRYASELGGPVEKLWGSLMKGGDADALRVANLTAAHLQPLLLAYPKDIPIIATHQLVALIAAAAGFTNVVNLVVDNYPQWFLCVPKTLNIVQGPVSKCHYSGGAVCRIGFSNHASSFPPLPFYTQTTRVFSRWVFLHLKFAGLDIGAQRNWWITWMLTVVVGLVAAQTRRTNPCVS
jgi:hypothetical protein